MGNVKMILAGNEFTSRFSVEENEPEKQSQFSYRRFLADMSGRSIAAIRHKRSKIQRS